MDTSTARKGMSMLIFALLLSVAALLVVYFAGNAYAAEAEAASDYVKTASQYLPALLGGAALSILSLVLELIGLKKCEGAEDSIGSSSHFNTAFKLTIAMLVLSSVSSFFSTNTGILPLLFSLANSILGLIAAVQIIAGVRTFAEYLEDEPAKKACGTVTVITVALRVIPPVLSAVAYFMGEKLGEKLANTFDIVSLVAGIAQSIVLIVFLISARLMLGDAGTEGEEEETDEPEEEFDPEEYFGSDEDEDGEAPEDPGPTE